MKTIPILLLLAFVSGCAQTLSGIGASSTFKCAAPEGASCNSVSGNYANSVAGVDTSGEKPVSIANEKGYFGDSKKSRYSASNREMLSSGMPVRTQTKVMRIWIGPYIDRDGDLVDQSYTYVTLDEGRWLIEHNKQRIYDDYQPVRLLGSSGSNTQTDQPLTTQKPVTQKPSGLDSTIPTPPLPGDFPK